MNQTQRELLERKARYGLRRLRELEARDQLLEDINDWPTWMKILDMDVGSGAEAYYDPRENSPHEEFRLALEDPTIKGLGVFMPRGVGKTFSVLLPWVVREIVRDPEITILIGSETEDIAIEQRTTWIRAKLMLLQEKGYGSFRSTQWAAGRFTVKRKAKIGGQPTVVAWGAHSSGTGRHWQLGIFDDLYGELSAENPEIRATVTRKFERILLQRMPTTRTILVGTMWPGRETYYYRIRRDPRYAKLYKVMSYEDRDKRGRILFKCLTPEFLERQRIELPPGVYRSQYKNRVVEEDELDFEPEDFHIGIPPTNVQLATYMVTDSAFSIQRDRKASYSVLAIIQKTPDNVAYVMDLEIGRWPADLFPRKLIGMYEKWRQSPFPTRWYLMENQGPGGQYPAHIADVALLLNVEPPIHHAVSHAKANKIVRIENSRAPIRAAKIVFSPDLDRAMFHKHGGDAPTGLLGDDYMRFSHSSKLRFDGPDAIADAQAKDQYGLFLCPPPEQEKIKKPSTLYSRSLARLRQSGARRYFN